MSPWPPAIAERSFRFTVLTVALCAAGVIVFGVVHAIAIQPIWWRLPGGLPFALAAAIPVVWLYHELQRAGRWGVSVRDGMWFGVLCWAADLPATAFANGMRLVYNPVPRPEWVDIVAAVLAFIAGATVFGLLGRNKRASLAGGLAILVLLATGGGAVPVVNSHRAAGLWIGFLVVKACGGAMLSLGYRALRLDALSAG